jgi:hypothetical protein
MPNYDKWKLQAPPENEHEATEPILYRCTNCQGYFNEDGAEYTPRRNEVPLSYDDVFQCTDCKDRATEEYGRDN